MESVKNVEKSNDPVKIKPTIVVSELIEIIKKELEKMGVNYEA